MGDASDNHLRIMFIVGGLGAGGAEKQLLYMLRALKDMGAEILAISLTQGEFHERSLVDAGIQLVSVAADSPPARLMKMVQAARTFRPQFIQATHFFASIYAGAAGRLTGIPSIGAVRGDFEHDLAGSGRAARWTAQMPSVLLANSYNARENALRFGISPRRIHVLPNVLDVDEFDRLLAGGSQDLHFTPDRLRVATVARLVPVKHLHIFLQAVALARSQMPDLQGVIVGGGPLEADLRRQAAELNLMPGDPSDGILFMGERSDVPSILGQCHLYSLTSLREGFPNVLLEAMAASLPIVATPAGETRQLVRDGENGFLTPLDDPGSLSERLLTLARSADLRRVMGQNGRRMVEQNYSIHRLPDALLSVYTAIAQVTRNRRALDALQQVHARPATETATL